MKATTMKATTMKATINNLAVIMSLALSLSSAQAILINFESPNYTTTGGTSPASVGNLQGQGGTTKWDQGGTTGTERVVANTGVGGSQGLTGQSLAQEGAYRFIASNTDLGGTFSGASSIIAYSYQMNLTSSVAGTLVINQFSSADNSGQSLRISLESSGHIRLRNGSTDVYAKTTSGGATNFAVGASFVTISGLINYGTKTYTVTVDGVSQLVAGVGSNANFGFVGSGATTGNIFYYQAQNGTSGQWRQSTIDNLNLNIVPEPATMALLAMSLCAISLLRSRKAKACHKA